MGALRRYRRSEPGSPLCARAWRAILCAALGSSLLACDQDKSPAHSGLAETPPPSELPFFLHLVGSTSTDANIYSIAVDDRYVYWRSGGGEFWRVPTEGGEGELFFTCPACQFWPEPSRDGLMVFLSGADLVQVSRDTKEESRLTLPFSHGDGGGLLIEDDFIYTAAPGCAAIHRVDRKSNAIEVMYVPGVSYPGRGRTRLTRSGESLVCASPTELFTVPSWGQPAQRIFSGADCLFDVVAVGHTLHWWQIPGANSDVDSFGTIPLAGGSVSWASLRNEGADRDIAYVQAADALVVGTFKGIRGFSRDTGLIDFLIPADKVEGMAANDDAVFVGFSGMKNALVHGTEGKTLFYWIGRIPFQTIVDAKAAR